MLIRRVLPALLLLAAVGCNTVEFHEKEAFADRVMDLADDPTWVHFEQKVRYSSEGAIGGVGTGAGGGCGCY